MDIFATASVKNLTFSRYTDNFIFSLATIKMRIIAGIDNGMSVICDIVIMGSLCYYLHSRRTGFRRRVVPEASRYDELTGVCTLPGRTDSILNRLIIYTVNRGALTA